MVMSIAVRQSRIYDLTTFASDRTANTVRGVLPPRIYDAVVATVHEPSSKQISADRPYVAPEGGQHPTAIQTVIEVVSKR